MTPFHKFPKFNDWLENTLKDSDVMYMHPLANITQRHYENYQDRFETSMIQERAKIIGNMLKDTGFQSSEHVTKNTVTELTKKKKIDYFLNYEKTKKKIINLAIREVSRI